MEEISIFGNSFSLSSKMDNSNFENAKESKELIFQFIEKELNSSEESI